MTKEREPNSESVEALLDGESLAMELDGIARDAFPELNPAQRRHAIARANVTDLIAELVDLGLLPQTGETNEIGTDFVAHAPREYLQ